MRSSAERAAQLRDGLPERYQALIQALLAWRRSEAGKAEILYRAVLLNHPQDIDAWLGLGEVRFHSGPLSGRSISAAKDAWERVLFLDPKNRLAPVHLARIAALAGDTTSLTALPVLLPDATPWDLSRSLEVMAWRAIVLRRPGELESVLARLSQGTDATLLTTVWQLVIFSRDLETSERFVRLLLEPGRGAWLGHLGNLLLGHLHAAKGQTRASEQKFRATQGLREAGLTHEAYLATLPFLKATRSRTARMREQVAALPSTVPAGSQVWTLEEDLRHPHLRPYLLGILSAALGEGQPALRHAAELERTSTTSEIAPLAQDFANEIRARVAIGEGRFAGAMKNLENIHVEAPWERTLVSPFFARAAARFLRAEMYRELGQYDLAREWYESLGELSPYEIVLLAPAHLRRAQMHELQGENALAAEQYERFIELWRDCDPELRPTVEEARRGIERMVRRS